jgi:hypothetical protein
MAMSPVAHVAESPCVRHMSSEVVDIQSKLMAIKSKAKKIKLIETSVAKQLSCTEDTANQQSRCLPMIFSCLPGFHRGAKPEMQNSATRSKFKVALFGVSKEQKRESIAIETAMTKVASRLEDLEARAHNHRQVAIAEKQYHRTTDALRELRKAKLIDRQIEITRGALDALERQMDTLSDVSLQRELASALTSTSKQMKNKTKGLVDLADSAVEATHELQDEATDISHAFEGLNTTSSSRNDIDDETLMAELNAMTEIHTSQEEQDQDERPHHPSSMESKPRAERRIARQKVVTVASDDEVEAVAFPTVPSLIISKRRKQREENIRLISSTQ